MRWLALKERAVDSLLAIVALGCALLTVLLAQQHPVAPFTLTAFLGLVILLVARHPASWLFFLPALLPVFSWAPWTGWWLLGEWDLLVLAVLGGGYARCFRDRRRLSTRSVSRTDDELPSLGALWTLFRLVLAISVLFAAWRGWALADDPLAPGIPGHLTVLASWTESWTAALFGDYAQGWNALRVSKGFVWALLLWPLLLRFQAKDPRRIKTLFARGMLIGLALVCAWVVWERLVYVGLFNFALPYRTTAGFWEMHVGGGAIDAYLAMAVPFAFWALWTAPSGWRWWLAACLAFWALYAVLTTYSRGVLGSVAIALFFLAWLAWQGRIAPVHGIRTHRLAWSGLAFLLVVEVVLALAGGNFMAKRLLQAEDDLKGRWAHWTAGVGLLRSPQDWLLGLGAGRLPAQFSRQVPGADFVGRAQWHPVLSSAPAVLLSGPARRAEIAEDFGFSQRVPLQSGGAYTVRLRVLSPQPVLLILRVCEQHLLYALRCQARKALVPESSASQVWHSYPLVGPELGAGSGLERLKAGLFSVAVLEAGREIQLHEIELLDPLGQQVLRNTTFATGMQRWFSVASNHFEPWHMDNLYLDILLERGIWGLLVFFGLLCWCSAVLHKGLIARQQHAGVLSASLLACLVLGLVISFTELPRLTLLLLLVLMVSGLPAERKRQG